MKWLALALAALLVAAILVVALVLGGFFDNIPNVFPSASSTPTPKPSQQPSTLPFGSSPSPTLNEQAPLMYSYQVVATFPHDPAAFTEGLVYSDGVLYESTGSFPNSMNSSLRRVDLASGSVLQKQDLDPQYFGEGIAVVNDSIVQLTWQNHLGFVYDRSNFSLTRTFSYPTDGWGLTFNGSHLIMSDGSANLYFFDPETFQQVGQVTVKDGNVNVTNLNELEYINGDVYANVWMQQKIAIINPLTGQVKAWIDLTGIFNSANSEKVLNGIAFDSTSQRLFVTGKEWANLYQIQLVL